MHRPDHSSADPDGISSGVAGYTEGNANATPPIERTKVTADAINDLTESLCRVVERSGLTLVKSDYDQIDEAINRRRFWAMVNDWRRTATPPTIAGGIGFANDRFFASEAAGAIQWSLTGESWDSGGTAGAGTSNAFGYLDPRYVAVGAAIYYSNTLSGAWTLASTTPSDVLNAVTSDGTTLCAVGDGGVIYTSTDGDTWTSRTADASYAGDFTAVAWSADLSLFIAAGTLGEIQTSPDGTTWTSRLSSGTNRTSIAIADSGRIFVAATAGGSAFSDDAVTWTAGAVSVGYVGAYAGGLFATTSVGATYASVVGGASGTWINAYDTIYATAGTRAIATGNGRMIMRQGGLVFWWPRGDFGLTV